MIKTATIVFSLLILLSGCNQSNEDTASPIPISIEPAGASSNVDMADNSGLKETTNSEQSINEHRSNAITRAVAKAEAAIVSITVTELQRGYTRDFDSFFFRFFERPIQREVQSLGSGFIISADGLIVTNEHVASKQAKTIVVALTNGEEYEAELLGADEFADFASRQTFPDGTNMLQLLHNDNYIKKIKTTI